MKKLFIVIILLIAAGFIAPKFIGSVVESEHQSAIDKLNNNPAITINSTTFTRNWFHGKAVTEMTILIQQEEIEDIRVIVEENLSFGPVMFTDEGVQFALSYSQANINFKELVVDEEIASFINEKIHLTGLLTFSKDIISTIVVDEISKEIDGNKVDSASAIGQFTLENNNRLYGKFHWAGLTAITRDNNFTIEAVNFSLDQTLISGDYYQGNAISSGDFDFTIAAIQAKNTADNAVFTLDNLLISAISTVTKDLMQVKMKYSADKIASAGQQLENANLEIVFDGLSIKVLQEANSLMTAISANGEAGLSAATMEKLSTLTTEFLADDPVIEIKDFSVETPEGKIESAMHISADKKLFDGANIMSIMAALKADVNGKAPLPFFTKLGLAPMVNRYVQQGFIMQKEEELTINASFAQGQLQINGHVIPL